MSKKWTVEEIEEWEFENGEDFIFDGPFEPTVGQQTNLIVKTLKYMTGTNFKLLKSGDWLDQIEHAFYFIDDPEKFKEYLIQAIQTVTHEQDN